MKVISLDNTLIDNFRESIITNHNLLEKYRYTIEGKNKLNIIYSAMDWLNVAVDGLEGQEINNDFLGYDHKETVKLMQFMATVDLIIESIQQLCRVLDVCDNLLSKESMYPYKKTNHIFHKEVSDDLYFKHLRAIFGAHPVNLKSIDGVNRKDNIRYYASWAASGKGLSFDFVVNLYSNDSSNDNSQFIGINIDDVNAYAEERYNLLKEFMEISENTKAEFLRTMLNSIIPESQDFKEQIKILKHENTLRFGEISGYAYILDYIDTMLKVDYQHAQISFNKNIISEYIDYLKSLIPVIRLHLQAMEIVHVSKKINALGYEFEKINAFLSYGEHKIGEEYFFGLVVYGELPIEFRNNIDFYLYRLVLDSYLHYKSKTEEKILYKNLIPKEYYIDNGGAVGFFKYDF